ncbi:uncharacterized protein EV420DRAFT_1555981 [Desarmillaria tabescens]|uniref:Uncharacterized protein n=1 Tax=Armillaria tabescens TaxID=1929756 RepID=A0AA39K8N0_ARMTA|nr:uncharacterized protein EV420DRAFT_1555981 [Desarmillaria tabescens]KAK0454258.1 hypothetical protein EV420DRAFT_1555981 [Desarmillaria tabescens]
MLRVSVFLCSFVIHVGLASSVVHRRDLNLTAQESGLKFDIPNLIRPQSTTVSLPSVPSACVRYTGSGKECAGSMDAVNVTFADCGSPYTICRCSSANITLDDAIDALARVPVGLRRYVGTVMVMPGSSAHAYTYTSSGEIHFFGVCSQRTWIHESTHAASGALGINAASGSGSWEEAVSKDTCVPDNYAKTNLAEDLAQMSVVKVYSLLNKNSLPLGFTVDCMSNQWAFLDGLPLYNPDTLLGGSCSFEPDNAEALHNIAPPITSTVSSSSLTKVVLASSSGSTVSTASSPASTTLSTNSSILSRYRDATGIYATLALPLFVFLLQTGLIESCFLFHSTI